MRGGGGGGGGSSSSGGGGTPVSSNPQGGTQATPDLVIPTIPSSAPPIANIARARPRPGSVTQSSNVGADGITLDQITFDRSNFTISNRNGFSFTNPDNGNNSDYYSTIYDPLNHYNIRKVDKLINGINPVYPKEEYPKIYELQKRIHEDNNFRGTLNGLKGGVGVGAYYRETDYISNGLLV